MSYFELKNGEQLYYEDVGTGPETIIMLHGYNSSHNRYSIPVSRLKDKLRCITYDHRGHCNSKAATRETVTMETLASDLNEIICGLSLDKFTLLGWSMGAGVALTYIDMYGCSALKQLVLSDMSPKMLNEGDWNLGLFQGKFTQETLEQLTQKAKDKDFYSLFEAFTIGVMPHLAKLPRFIVRRTIKKKMQNCDEGVLRSLAISMEKQDNRDVVEKITVPLTYLYAEPGSLFSPKLAEWYGEQVKVPYKTVCFPNSDHRLIAHYPEKFADEVGKFFP